MDPKDAYCRDRKGVTTTPTMSHNQDNQPSMQFNQPKLSHNQISNEDQQLNAVNN